MDGYEYYDHATYSDHLRVYDTYNGQNYEESSVSQAVVGYSQRSASVSSDHHRPTPFEARFAKVVTNVPAHVVDVAFIGKRDHTFHLSVGDAGASSFVYPPGWAEKLSNAEDRSFTKARERLKDGSGFDIGVALAEARASAEMLSGVAGKMSKGLSSLRSLINQSRSRKAKAALTATAGAWLEGYYGWGSLARDASSIVDVLVAKVNKPLIITSHATTKIEQSWGPTDTPNYRRRWSECDGFVKVGYRAIVEDEFARSIDKWGLANPYAIAWEVVPLSFVIDWFVPIGGILSSLSATVGLRFLDGYVSRVQNSVRTVRYYNTNPFKSEQELVHGEYVVKGKEFTRRPLYGFEFPRLYANENPFNTNRVANASALVTQAILGGEVRTSTYKTRSLRRYG